MNCKTLWKKKHFMFIDHNYYLFEAQFNKSMRLIQFNGGIRYSMRCRTCELHSCIKKIVITDSLNRDGNCPSSKQNSHLTLLFGKKQVMCFLHYNILWKSGIMAVSLLFLKSAVYMKVFKQWADSCFLTRIKQCRILMFNS